MTSKALSPSDCARQDEARVGQKGSLELLDVHRQHCAVLGQIMQFRGLAFGLLATTALAAPSFATPIQTVFVIALENYNFTQPVSRTSPERILGNPAAPYVNSLITPGNPNATMTSYATNYQSAEATHPSEPKGGEVELLMNADLQNIHKVIMETHYWSGGEQETDAMIRKLILDGFSIHLSLSGQDTISLRRSSHGPSDATV